MDVYSVLGQLNSPVDESENSNSNSNSNSSQRGISAVARLEADQTVPPPQPPVLCSPVSGPISVPLSAPIPVPIPVPVTVPTPGSRQTNPAGANNAATTTTAFTVASSMLLLQTQVCQSIDLIKISVGLVIR